MFRTVFALLMVLAHGSAQFNSSCVQIVNSTAAGVSPYFDDEPSLAFTMEGATNLKTNTVSLCQNRHILGANDAVVDVGLLMSQHETPHV